MAKPWNGSGIKRLTDAEVEDLFFKIAMRDAEPVSNGSPSRFVEIDLLTGNGVREVVDENGEFITDFENNCFKTESFTFDALRLRRDASEASRAIFNEYAKREQSKLPVRLVA